MDMSLNMFQIIGLIGIAIIFIGWVITIEHFFSLEPKEYRGK